MKHLVLLFTLFIATPCFAISAVDVDNAGFSKLSAAEQAKIIAEVERVAQSPAVANEAALAAVSKWADLGTSIGKGLVSAAKELGVAANEFAQTSVGQMVTILIVWHFIGSTIIHVVGGLLVWIVGYTFTYVIMRRAQPLQKRFKDGELVEIYRDPLSEGAASGYWIANAFITILGLIVIFSF